jgi:hypothetical protein
MDENSFLCNVLINAYQLDLTTPGIAPFEANILKQIRQIPNFLIKALLRPQIGHLLYWRVENFCFRWALTIREVFAKVSSIWVSGLCIKCFMSVLGREPFPDRNQFRKGIPKCLNKNRPSASVFAVVTMEIFSPFTLSILS